METVEQIRNRIVAAVPGSEVQVIQNSGAAAQHSLLLNPPHALQVARFLQTDPSLRLDYCSNASGVDWPEKEIVETTKVKVAQPDGTEKMVDQKTKRLQPGYLETVYHLYSMELKHGPVIIRLRTGNRTDQVTLPSLTPVWRSCEFQEREIFDLFGIVFQGHPDLRRILMWDEYKDHPMRKDYVEPDDFEWEPTPHDSVLAKAKAHYPAADTRAEVTPPRSEPQKGGTP